VDREKRNITNLRSEQSIELELETADPGKQVGKGAKCGHLTRVREEQKREKCINYFWEVWAE
jgi:hypothetical protein